MDNNIIKNNTTWVFGVPKRSSWRCVFLGGENDGVSFRPLDGDVPNWFVRYCTRICLGFKWVKDEQKNS